MLPLSLLFSLDNESNFLLSVFLCLWPSKKESQVKKNNNRGLDNMFLFMSAPLDILWVTTQKS